ncbi:MAG: PriCT-2 domain-containing protein [Faecalibacterium prausnitzii]
MEHENDIKEALDFVSPSALTYEEWLMVGMGLKEAGLPVAVWEQWSARDGGRYHKGECIKKWESFHGSSKPVTQSSIFQLAYEHGWSGPAGHALDWGDELTVGPQQPALVDPRWVEEQELYLPDTWEPAQQLKRYLQALFEPDEYVAYVTESFMAADRRRPAKGCWDRTAGQLIEELDAGGGDVGKVMGDCDPEIGAWICFNPVDGTGRKDANVTSYRYALVECDNMEPGKQLAAIHQMEPPAPLVYPAARASTPSSGSTRRIMLSTASGSITSTPSARRTADPRPAEPQPFPSSRMPGILRAGQTGPA